MKPRGHKPGCRCVVCARPKKTTRKPAKKRAVRRNHGYENQARRMREHGVPNPHLSVRRNSAVRMNPRSEARQAIDDSHAFNKIVKLPYSTKTYRDLQALSDDWVDGNTETEFWKEDDDGSMVWRVHMKHKTKNPISHFPRSTRGRKGEPKWFILDLYSSRNGKIESRYKQEPRATMTAEAQGLVGRRIRGKVVAKVELSGPYARKPNAQTTRK